MSVASKCHLVSYRFIDRNYNYYYCVLLIIMYYYLLLLYITLYNIIVYYSVITIIMKLHMNVLCHYNYETIHGCVHCG